MTIVPGVDHMGIVYRPEAIRAILAALTDPAPEDAGPMSKLAGRRPFRSR